MRKRYHEETWGKKNFVRLSEQTGTGGTLNEDIKIHGSVSSLLRSSFFHRYLFSMFFFFFFAAIGKIIGNNRSPGREQ